MSRSLDDRSGQSLLEVLIATAIGAIMIIGAASVITPALRENSDTTKIQTAAAASKQLIDGVRAWADSDWHNVSVLSVGSGSQYYLIPGTSVAMPFVLATGTESLVAASTEGLIAYWKFDELSGATTPDFSGSGFDGALYSVSRTAGFAGGGYLFDGTSTQVIASSTTGLKYQGGDMTISVWVKPDPTDDSGYVISKPWNGSGQYNYYIKLSGGSTPTPTFFVSGSSSYSTTFGTSTTAGTWHNLAVTLQGATKAVRYYIDGKLTGSGTHTISGWSPSSGDANVRLVFGCIYPYGGSCGASTTYAYKGVMDEARIYSRVLSDTEIKSAYAAFPYWRYFYVDNVYRDSNGNVAGAGTLDPSTLKLGVVSGWAGAASSTMSTFISRSANRRYMQTDWSGGAGQEGPLNYTNSKFANASSNLVFSSSTATSSGFVFINGLQFQ